MPTLPALPCKRRSALRRWAAGVALLWVGLALAPAWAHGKGGGGSGSGRNGGDHERARGAVQAGEVLPLATLLEQLRRSHPGQVLEVEIDTEDGRVIYEVKLLHANGQLLKLDIDAATGQVLKVRQREK